MINIRDVVLDLSLSPTSVRVYLLLASSPDPLHNKDIADLLAINERTTRRAIANLQEAGWLSVRCSQGYVYCNNKKKAESKEKIKDPIIYGYIVAIKEGGKMVCLKVGITSNLDTRYKSLAVNSRTTLPLASYMFKEEKDCRLAELAIKSFLESGVVSKEDFGSGFSETLPPKMLQEAKEIFESFGGKVTV